MKKYLKTLAFLFSLHLLADDADVDPCPSIPCEMDGYKFSEFNGGIKGTTTLQDKLFKEAVLIDNQTDKVDIAYELAFLFEGFWVQLNTENIVRLDSAIFNNNQNYDLGNGTLTMKKNMTLEGAQSSDDKDKPTKLRMGGMDLNGTFNISNLKIQIDHPDSHQVFNNSKTSTLNIDNAQFVAFADLKNSGDLSINLNKSQMYLSSGDYRVTTSTTKIDLYNSALLQYDITSDDEDQTGMDVNISKVRLRAHSLLAGVYNIDTLEANDSIFGVGATKTTYIGTIMANKVSGKNNAFWLMGTKLENNQLALNTNIHQDSPLAKIEALINMPLMIIKGTVANDFITGMIVGEQGWTDTFVKEEIFKNYIKKYQVGENDNTYTIYSLKISGDGETFGSGAKFYVDNGVLKFGPEGETPEYVNKDSKVYVTSLEGVPPSQSILTGLTLDRLNGDDFKLKYAGAKVPDKPAPTPLVPLEPAKEVIRWTDLEPAKEVIPATKLVPAEKIIPLVPLNPSTPVVVLPTVAKIKPAVVRLASKYASFYDHAIQERSVARVSLNGVGLGASTKYANKARTSTFVISAGKKNDNVYFGAFAEFAKNSLSDIGAKIDKYGAGIYGGGIFQMAHLQMLS